MCPSGVTRVSLTVVLSTAIKSGSCVIAHSAFPQHPHCLPKPHQVSQSSPSQSRLENTCSPQQRQCGPGCAPGKPWPGHLGQPWGCAGALLCPPGPVGSVPLKQSPGRSGTAPECGDLADSQLPLAALPQLCIPPKVSLQFPKSGQFLKERGEVCACLSLKSSLPK